MKVLKGTIEGRARESRNAGDERNTSSPQLIGIDGSDQVLLSLIQVGEQSGVFLLQSFFLAHTGSLPWSGVLCNAYYFTDPNGEGAAVEAGYQPHIRRIGEERKACDRSK